MRKILGGFTLIEVTLFLAITGLLFLGVTIGVQNSIFQQRYNDSVQSFVDFLRSSYAETMNIQGINSEGGNTEYAVYGKLLVFGEECKLGGLGYNCDRNDDDLVFSYDVIGNANTEVGTTNILQALQNAAADVLIKNEEGKVVPAGVVESFMPKWGSRIQNTNTNNPPEDYKGSILIIRHPGSGTVYTYVSDKVIEVNERLTSGNSNVPSDLLTGSIGTFKLEEVNFCVNPDGDTMNNNRVNVRINKGARNSSGIETIYDVGENKNGNVCNGE